jgi:hypothetical protein
MSKKTEKKEESEIKKALIDDKNDSKFQKHRVDSQEVGHLQETLVRSASIDSNQKKIKDGHYDFMVHSDSILIIQKGIPKEKTEAKSDKKKK